MKTLSRSDIKKGMYFTVVRSVIEQTNGLTGKKFFDNSYQGDCMGIIAVDYPLIRFQNVEYSHSNGTINLEKYVIRELGSDFVDACKAEKAES